MDDPRLDYADGTVQYSDPEADYYNRRQAGVYAFIESRGDTEDAVWSMDGDDWRTFDNFYDGMAALWEHAARDLHADWAPERRLVLHNYDTGETKYFKATYIEVFDDQPADAV